MGRLIPLLFVTATAGLAYTPVQVGPNTCKFTPGSPGSGSLSCTFGSNVGANNVLVVGVQVRLGVASGVTSITDSRGSTYNLLSGSHDSVTGAWLFAGKPTSGGANTVTVTLNGTYYFGWLTMAEYDGTQLTTSTAGTSAASGTDTPQSCGSFTPTKNNVQVVAAIYHNNNDLSTLAAVPPMVSRVYGNDATERQVMLEDYFMATAASITPGTTNAGSVQSFSCAAAALVSYSSRPRRRTIQTLEPRGNHNPDWSFVFIADQHPNASGAPWVANSSYIVSKKIPWNIQGVFFSGDIRANGETQAGFWAHGWNNILGMGMPALAAHGNHDCDTDTINCNTRLTGPFDANVGFQRVYGAPWGPVNAFTQKGNDLGYFIDTEFGTQANYAIRFTVNGHKFLVFALEFGPRSAVMNWANALADTYPDHYVIWVSHQYLIANDLNHVARPCQTFDTFCAGSGPGYNAFPTTGLMMWDQMIKLHANSFLALCGHYYNQQHYGYLGAAGIKGNTVHEFIENFQGLGIGANDSVVRLLFHEQTKTMDIFLMSATSDTPYASWLGLAWPQL